MKRRIVATSVAALTVAAGGAAAVAATGGSQQEDSKAVIDDAAKDLGVQPSELSDALKKALANRVDAAVAAGQITKAEGDALKERIASQEYPLLGGLGHRGGPGGHGFHHLAAAAAYLGLSEAELRTQLSGDKTLADVAKARGKTVAGLVAALVADEKKELQEAVSSGRITQAQADELPRERPGAVHGPRERDDARRWPARVRRPPGGERSQTRREARRSRPAGAAAANPQAAARARSRPSRIRSSPSSNPLVSSSCGSRCCWMCSTRSG